MNPIEQLFEGASQCVVKIFRVVANDKTSWQVNYSKGSTFEEALSAALASHKTARLEELASLKKQSAQIQEEIARLEELTG